MTGKVKWFNAEKGYGLHQLARLCQDILSLRMMPGRFKQ